MYHALLSFLVDKAASLYGIDLVARNVATDFEKASINAFKEVFPQVVVSGCHFHLGQAVIRKVNELGLKTTYGSDSEFALHTRMLYGLAYLPTADVPAALEVIRLSMPPAGQAIIEYFDRTYVNGPVIRTMRSQERVHREAMFPPSMWNVAERFNNDLPTTTNHVEAWHRRLQTLIVFDHPSFFNCLHKLRQEQRHTEVSILRSENGFRRKVKRRSVIEHAKRLTTLMTDLRSGKKDLTSFLRGVAHAFGGEVVPIEGGEDSDGLEGTAGTTSGQVLVVAATASDAAMVPPLPHRGRRRLRSPISASVSSPATRCRLRDLPVRRANAASTAAIAASVEASASTTASASPVSPATSPASPATTGAPMGPLCPVCLVNAADTVIIPCGHCGCINCLRRVMGEPEVAAPPGGLRCPVCRSIIGDLVKLHFAA